MTDDPRNTEEAMILRGLRQCLGTAEGRAAIWWMLDRGRLFQISHTPGDPYNTAFCEGARNLASEILDRVNQARADSFALMMTEANERALHNDHRGKRGERAAADNANAGGDQPDNG